MLVLKAWLLWCPPCPLGLTLILLPFPWCSLSPQGRELTEMSLLGLSSPRSLTYCIISDCGSLSLLTILHRRKHLWWWPNKALTYAYSKCLLESFYCYVLFILFSYFSNRSIWFYLRSFSYLVPGVLFSTQCWIWVPSISWGRP